MAEFAALTVDSIIDHLRDGFPTLTTSNSLRCGRWGREDRDIAELYLGTVYACSIEIKGPKLYVWHHIDNDWKKCRSLNPISHCGELANLAATSSLLKTIKQYLRDVSGFNGAQRLI